MNGEQVLKLGRKTVGLIPFRVAAERPDIKWRVVKQVFQLLRQLRTILRAFSGRQAAEVQITERFRIIVRVAGFEELENGVLRIGPAQRIFGGTRRLGLQRKG